VVALLTGCDVKEKDRLRSEVDSLKIELETSNQMASAMQEIGMLMDSIDASRQLLRTDVVEGTSYDDYVSRMKDISSYIQETEAKIKDLEESVTTAKTSTDKYKYSL